MTEQDEWDNIGSVRKKTGKTQLPATHSVSVYYEPQSETELGKLDKIALISMVHRHQAILRELMIVLGMRPSTDNGEKRIDTHFVAQAIALLRVAQTIGKNENEDLHTL